MFCQYAPLNKMNIATSKKKKKKSFILNLKYFNFSESNIFGCQTTTPWQLGSKNITHLSSPSTMYTKVQAKFEVILAPHLTKICFSYLNNLLKPIVVDYTGHLTHSYEDLHTMKYLIENL